MLKGGRQTTRPRLRSASASFSQAHSPGTGRGRIPAHRASGPENSLARNSRPRDHTGVVAFCVSRNNGGGEIRPQAAAQTSWCGSVWALAAKCAAFQPVARQPDAARRGRRSPLKGTVAGERENLAVHRPGWGRGNKGQGAGRRG